MDQKGITKGVVKGLGEIVRSETGKRAVKEPIKIASQVLETTLFPSKEDKTDKKIAQLKQQDQQEIAKIKEQLKSLPKKQPAFKPRDIETEIQQVRKQKQIQLGAKEEEFLREIQQKREEERKQAEWPEPITPPAKRPRGLPPWFMKEKQGTKETKVRTGE